MTLFARAAFVLLVVASFAAFFVAQRLKSAPQVARLGRVTLHFSPNGDGRRDEAAIRVRIEEADDVTLSVVDEQGTVVRRLATAVPATPERSVRVRWDGRTDRGGRAPDGRYRIRVGLRRGGRAATLEPPLRLDTVAPAPTVEVGGPDGRRWIIGPDAQPVPFRLAVVSRQRPTEIRVLRTDGDAPEEVDRFTVAAGQLDGSWDGRRADGALAAPGTYQVVAVVRDEAGNVGRSAPPAGEHVAVRGHPGVSVRRLVAQPPADAVRAGATATFAVDSRGRPYRWSVRRAGETRARAEGRKRTGGPLELEAPAGSSGLYVLDLAAGQDRTAVPFAVQSAQPAPILVVLPAITWLGTDGLDDDRDGVPNLLAHGDAVRYPKLLQSGLPAGLRDATAALLAFLDEEGLRYDVATDLELTARRAGLDRDRAGVLLAGPLRWIPTPLARRLRRYAADGGGVAVFGADTLRRGVSVARDRLLRPLPLAAEDPFGTRVREPRDLPAGQELVPVADERNTGLLTGVETLDGFTRVEESAPAERVEVALAAVDVEALDDADAGDEPPPAAEPVVALTRVGEGFVVRVGLPEWGARLRANVRPVQQLTRNVADLLRGARPKIRSFDRPEPRRKRRRR